METYFVMTKTILTDGRTKARTLVLEADKYIPNQSTGTYDFFKIDECGNDELVASVSFIEVFFVSKKEAWQSDWIEDIYEGEDDDPDEDEDETVDECDDCLIRDILACDLFREGVADMVAALTEADNAATETPKEEFPIEHWKKDNLNEWWGFHTDEGFVYFPSKEKAEWGRKQQLDGAECYWSHKDLTGYTKVED
jgi:hypothetical protein